MLAVVEDGRCSEEGLSDVRFEDVLKAFDGRPVYRGGPRGAARDHAHGDGRKRLGQDRHPAPGAGLIKPDRGRITVLDIDATPLREEALLPLRQRMGFVFQGAALFDSLTAYENVAYPLREHARLPEADVAERVHTKLALVGLSGRSTTSCRPSCRAACASGSGIARALMLEPELVLYDEPTAGLDPTNARLITELVEGLKAQAVTETAMIVTHDLEFARTVSDLIAILIEGRIAQVGSPEAIFQSAQHEVQAFLAGSTRPAR